MFEYQKFKPNSRLQARIDAIAEKYLSEGIALEDDDLNVAAAGDLLQGGAPLEEADAESR